jgi:multiple sugar transport system permease protein
MTLREKIEFKNALLFIAPWLVGFLVFVAYPIISVITFSFADYSVLSKPQWIGFQNYRVILQDEIALRAIFRTVGFALIAIPLGLTTALILALLLETSRKGIGWFRTALFIPALVPQVAVATLTLWVFANDGVVNQALDFIQIKPISWISQPHILTTLLLISLWSVGNTMIIFLAGLQQVPGSLYESAEIDGANYLRRVWYISLPMLSPVIFFNLIISTIGALSQFTIPYFFDKANLRRELGDSINFLSMEINTQALQNLRMGYASAISVVLLFFVTGLTIFMFRCSNKFVYYGDSK